MDKKQQEREDLDAARSDSDGGNENETTPNTQERCGGQKSVGEASFSPSKAVHELVQKAMLACFVTEKYTPLEREQLVRDIQNITRSFAKRLLLSPEDCEAQDDPQAQYVLPRERVVPPSAYFSFHDNGRMHLPIVDWSAFRGYSVAVWINVDFCVAKAKKEISTGDLYAKFNLFRFTNGSNTLGVEASLEYSEDTNSEGNHGVLLNVSSCAPGASSDTKKALSSASVAASSSLYSPEWRRIQYEVNLVPGEWHLLVISHSLHYVKKSKVTCYVDNKLQFREELVYPSGLVTASKCTVGGGRNTKTKIASVAMYHDELSKGTIELMYALGPMVSSFNRTLSTKTTLILG
ncbi:hypothetical protein BBJ29_003286 [Phytophthora kernoviae]|uniref:Uncharacterized protein n=1 Tax=Phytophthora kernoviae TaxID=325452 RepID=A0A3F2RUM6_9STRA|nr:hypothetical protein BBP00_00003386 [Phytophthora kernoviae]RLN68802.1 hypothetical protein BBJ29_003286 [Phytophthora kernoviae]